MEWGKIPVRKVPPEFYEFRHVYLSSLEDENLREFYGRWRPMLPMTTLSRDNLRDAIFGEDSLLIYAEDIFPARHKMSIHEVAQRFIENDIDLIANECYLSNEWASIHERDVRDIDKLIPLFDQGYQTIAVVDDAGFLQDEILRSTFKADFPSRNFRIWGNLFLPYSEDERAVKRQVAELFYGTAREEIPLVRDGKVVAYCVRGVCVGVTGRKDIRKVQPLYWHLISDEVARDFFGEKRKILLSSDAGSLGGFKERFSGMLDITVFKEALWPDYADGKFDMLIYGGDIWPVGGTQKYFVEDLFAGLLNETIHRLMQRENVHTFYIDMGSQGYAQAPNSDIQYRKHYEIQPIDVVAHTIAGTHHDYFAYTDRHSGNLFNIVNGERLTTDTPKQYFRSIYFLGPCTALGFWSKDSETTESVLQRRLNDYAMPYRVVNCGYNGGTGSPINELYRLMEIGLSHDDIVIVFNSSPTWDVIGFTAPANYYRSNVHWLPQNRHKDYLVDSVGHFTAEGNKAYADYIFSLIEPHLTQEPPAEPPRPVIFPERPYRDAVDPALTAYLSTLATHRVEAAPVGAIVMNCNPFTRGHRYLIDQVRRQVAHLFVFIVEEDLSDFSFDDRFAIARANCAGMKNVTVLPSGQYMISVRTFAEYFNKDALQEQTIIPANDVRTFGRHIASCLGITKRFAGEEPLDAVTRQYNEAMREILPEYGVEFVEIPRLALDTGEVVNATKVRALLREGDLPACRAYLTPATYDYIKRDFARLRQRLLEKAAAKE